MGDYRGLLAWKRARSLAAAVYLASECFPARERFCLGAQMRRAAVSVASNIAEGAGRGTDAELRRFLRIARGSIHELQTQIAIASDLHLLTEARSEDLNQAAEEAGRLIQGLIRSLR